MLIGFFGKSVIEQWLKQNYKEWELNTEKPYKEDFLRLETQLKAIAAKEQTKFELATHPTGFQQLRSFINYAQSYTVKFLSLCIIRSFAANGKNQGFAEMLKDSNAKYSYRNLSAVSIHSGIWL